MGAGVGAGGGRGGGAGVVVRKGRLDATEAARSPEGLFGLFTQYESIEEHEQSQSQSPAGTNIGVEATKSKIKQGQTSTHMYITFVSHRQDISGPDHLVVQGRPAVFRAVRELSPRSILRRRRQPSHRRALHVVLWAACVAATRSSSPRRHRPALERTRPRAQTFCDSTFLRCWLGASW